MAPAKLHFACDDDSSVNGMGTLKAVIFHL